MRGVGCWMLEVGSWMVPTDPTDYTDIGIGFASSPRMKKAGIQSLDHSNTQNCSTQLLPTGYFLKKTKFTPFRVGENEFGFC
ncbi:hypothetical protein CBW16_03565 [Flavobacteriaceae bacterium JJC]|nr:hypothetical protein CBW16_03565 [Flavobacteriaceae bacterium JJC]